MLAERAQINRQSRLKFPVKNHRTRQHQNRSVEKISRVAGKAQDHRERHVA